MIPISANFDVLTGLPIDGRITAVDIAARNAITWVYNGLICFVESEGINYQYVNGNWQLLSGVSSAESASWASASLSASVLKDNPTLYYRKGGGIGNDLVLRGDPTPGGAGVVLADINGNPYWAVYTGAGERMYFYTASHFLQEILADLGITASGGFLGDLQGTASWATNAISASYAPNLYPQQYQVSASWASSSISASYVCGNATLLNQISNSMVYLDDSYNLVSAMYGRKIYFVNGLKVVEVA